MFYVYIIQSADGRFYTGYTTDLDRRLKEHQAGSGGKFTRSFGAKKILYHESHSTKSKALKREIQIKQLSRAEKEELINGNLNKLYEQEAMMNEIISINPANMEIIGKTRVTEPEQIPAIVNRLRSKFYEWREVPLEERIRIIKRAAEIIRKKSDSISELVTKEMGKIFSEAKGEVDNAAYRLEYFAKTAPKAIAPWEDNISGIYCVSKFQAVGVVAAIKPWNFPVGIPLWSIAPALLAGNTVMFKPSERTPLVGESIFSIFQEAGLPENVMEIVHGAEEIGKAIVASEVDMIAFVGSQAVGRYIMTNSTHNFRKLAFELGGKDPMIVCADCDFEKTSAAAIAGVFKNCGQVCCSVERIFVSQEIFESFSESAVKRASQLQVGDGLNPTSNMGPLSHSEEIERIERHLKDAADKGARILYGGKRIEGKGYFFQPTVITNVNEEMLLLKEEIFGPVMVLIPYKNIDDAITKANSTRFGLTASVWSADINKADKIAQHLQAGTIAINQIVSSIVECPWGGVKGSGVGRMLGPEAVREFTETVNYRYPQRALCD
jgi:acyl-CoA reductase-like NAD-dependent aldehyde dehydrogenase